MANKQTVIGGDRLGAGGKRNVYLHGYERSNHDLSHAWRSTMASGTLVPFMNILGLPGDTFDIDLDIDIQTLPTLGPLFGKYKIQLDVFMCPIRNYIGKLHMNMLDIGNKMQTVKIPQVSIEGYGNVYKINGDNAQISPSSVMAYCGIRGLGVSKTKDIVKRNFNAIWWLQYLDTYKQYYANKQEEIGYIVHNELNKIKNGVERVRYFDGEGRQQDISHLVNQAVHHNGNKKDAYMLVKMNEDDPINVPSIYLVDDLANLTNKSILSVFDKYFYMGDGVWKFYDIIGYDSLIWHYYFYDEGNFTINRDRPILKEFPLENIDKMRMEILKAVDSTSPFIIDKNSLEPYCLPFKRGNIKGEPFCATNKMEGLLIKTYQSDLFNNWVSSEWVDGTGGINEVSSVDTSSGSFTIDQLNIASKVYNMLNRIAISGGTYNDYLEVQYDENSRRMYEHPVYIGGKIRELAFQEVISQSATTFEGVPQPLGQLGGKGVVAGKNKGGKITVKCTEPCYIMGIVSLTPYVDYSQGNTWDVNLKTIADLHVPALDGIGYQDLITDQMAWFDTELDATGEPQFKSAGKIPAWTNYMTAVNRVLGNFAEEDEEMFMILNRRYERNFEGIRDLTTYIDPSKFNHIFADARLDAQNFRANIWVGLNARRKMSAKVMPNL